MKEMKLRPHAWDEIFQKEGRVFYETFPRFDWLAQQFKKHRCERILDFGCGSGRHLVHLTKLGFNVVGLDYSPAGLRMAKQWLRNESLEAPLLLGDMRYPLPIKDELFNGILSTQVIHHTHLEVIQRTVNELWRILAPGGLAFVTVPAHKHENEEYVEIELNTFVPLEGPEKGLPYHILSVEEYEKLFQAFNIIELSVRGERVITLLATKASDSELPFVSLELTE
jgi:SAM-dependent methyltransferase